MKKGILFILIASMLLTGCSSTQGIESNLMEIHTAYGNLEYPATLEEYLRHIEVSEGNVTMEVFYMKLPDEEIELFRIIYGDPNVGTLWGHLKIEGKEVPVSYSVCEYIQDDFPDEESWNHYFFMMDGFNNVLNSIQSDERFVLNGEVEAVPNIMIRLKYWDVPLPENVYFEEEIDGDIYQVAFFGNLEGENIPLYTLQLGEPALETSIGYFMLDGNAKLVSVLTNDDILEEGWTETQTSIIYNMMDSVNYVLDAILADERYVPVLEAVE